MATTDNRDGPEEDTFEEYLAECSDEAKAKADADWDGISSMRVCGTWETTDNAKHDLIVKELLAKMAAAAYTHDGELHGVPDDHFDHIVHDCASNTASDINNGGFEAQLRFMLEEWGEEETRKAVDEAIDALKKEIE